MPFINFNERKKIKIWEGVQGFLFHSEQATFAHITLQKGAGVVLHNHIHEQWTHVIEGEMLFKINGEEKLLTPAWLLSFLPIFHILQRQYRYVKS